MIGVSPDASEKLLDFLREQGYIVEQSQERDAYGLYIDRGVRCEESEEKGLIERIETADVPLIKLGRWPDGMKSALTVTGDLDCITLMDFFVRIFEV